MYTHFLHAMLADAAWESFVDKKEVTSSNLEHMIQKTLQNIHWERKPRTRGKDDEDEWDARRRRRAIMFDDEDDEIATANSNNRDRDEQEEGRDDEDDFLVHDHNDVQQDVDCGGRALSSQVPSQGRIADRASAPRKLSACIGRSAVV